MNVKDEKNTNGQINMYNYANEPSEQQQLKIKYKQDRREGKKRRQTDRQQKYMHADINSSSLHKQTI